MSKEKRKQKSKNGEIKELQKLKQEIVKLEEDIKKQKIENFKQFNIRNLKVFGHTCNFLAPFVISTGLTIGTFSIIGGGLPFYKDEIIKYKTYSLDYQTNGNITMNETYIKTKLFNGENNKLTIYTPWEYKDDQYIRYKREYDINDINTLDLFDAVLEENYDYITKNIKEYKEETQIINKIEENEKQDYYFDAKLYMLDKEDILKFPETDLKNTIITIIELILSLGIGSASAHFRKFKYSKNLQITNNIYKSMIKEISPMKEELIATNKKILTLSKKIGGSKNVRQ